MNLRGKSVKVLFKIFLLGLFSQNTLAANEVDRGLNKYFSHPITYYLGFSAGFVTKTFPLYTNCEDAPNNNTQHRFVLASPSFSVLWTLVNKFCCNNLGGYPELGFKLKYSRTNNEGNTGSLLLQFSPSKEYDSGFEIVPSFAIGVSYIAIAAWKRAVGYTQPSTPGETPQKYEEPDSKYSTVPFRKEFGLEADISLDAIIRIREHWKAKISLGCTIIPSFSQDTTKEASQYVEAGYKDVVDPNYKEEETEELRKNILRGVDTTLIAPYIGLYLGYTTNITDIKFDVYQPERNFVKIKPFYKLSNYDKDAEFIWSLLQDMIINVLDPSKEDDAKEKKKNYSKRVSPTINSKETISRYDTYHIFGVALEWNILFAKRCTFILGFEMEYDSSAQKIYKNLFLPRNYPVDFSLNLGLGYVSGKLSIDNIFGIYLINPKMPLKLSGAFQNLLYYKVGIDYKIFNNFTLGCNLKLKMAIKYDDYDDTVLADFGKFSLDNFYNFALEASAPEISIGYSF